MKMELSRSELKQGIYRLMKRYGKLKYHYLLAYIELCRTGYEEHECHEILANHPFKHFLRDKNPELMLLLKETHDHPYFNNSLAEFPQIPF